MLVRLLGSGGFAPSDRRETACALLVEDRQALLIDAGTGARRLLTDRSLLQGVERVHVVLTHFHLDHVVGLFYLPALELPIEVWGAGASLGGASTRALVERLLGTPFAPPGFLEAIGDVHELDAAGETVVGAFSVRVRIQRLHSSPTLALRVNDELVWCTDSGYDEENVEFARGAAVLCHDALGGQGGHPTAPEAAQLAVAAGVGRLIVIHVDPELADDERLLERVRPIFPAAEVARDGMVVEVGK